MKHAISSLDKVSLFIVPFNYLSFLAAFWSVHPSCPEYIPPIFTAISLLYGAFGSIGGFFFGISANVISLTLKRKEDHKITRNLVCLILYLLMIPIWWKLLLRTAVLSV